MRTMTEKIQKLEVFTEKLLNYCGWKINRTQKNNYDYTEDYITEKVENRTYSIQVKNSMNFDYIKMKYYIEKLQKKKEDGYENVVFVYNYVRKDIIEMFNDIAIVLDITNILYIIKNSIILRNELMSILDFSIENIELREPCIEIKIKESGEKYFENKKEILRSIGTGKNCFRTYEEFCVDTLKYLFLDKLELWEEQNKTEDKLNVFDLICKIKNGVIDDFFIVLEKYFQSKYIIFEFKNYADLISQYEVCTTEKYLYQTALRKVAIMITRNGIDSNGEKMIKGILRETGKLIIVLDDKEFEQMIELKEKGENPSIILTNKLDFMLTHLEK